MTDTTQEELPSGRDLVEANYARMNAAIATLKAENAALQVEVNEQARLLGMSGSKELALQSQAAVMAGLLERVCWVSVEDRLPPFNKSVALMDATRFEASRGEPIIDAGCLIDWGGGYWSVRARPALSINAYTHWMLLPSPPAARPQEE